jgi:putative endonuclease
MNKSYYVYIKTNDRNTVLYIGVTNSLQRRIYEHRNGLIKGFSKMYNVNKLVYAEETNSIRDAIQREKELKKSNLDFDDLYGSLS